MSPLRPLLLSCCALSLLLGDAASLSPMPTPALAHERCRRGYGCGRDRIDAGDVIVGIAIIAGIAAIASAAKNDDRDDDWEDDARDGRAGRAVDACALEAERRAHRQDYDAVVRDITSVERISEGYRVRGRIEVVNRFGRWPRQEGWGDDDGRDDSMARQIRFTCLTTLSGRVRELRFNDPGYSWR